MAVSYTHLDVYKRQVFMTYANVVFSYDSEKFISTCADIGIDGLILPDIPLEERGEFAPICKKYGLDLVPLVAPTSADRIAMIAKESDGFTYVVSSLGVTGVRSKITTDIGAMVRICLLYTSIPVARYHSLAADASSLPCCLDITAATDDGEIMLSLIHISQ